MSLIRVYSSDQAKIDEAVERLRTLGVELLTSEGAEPEELVLFYLSRMNNKLDNLGQLRHLVKVERHLSEMKYSLKALSDVAKVQQQAHEARVDLRRTYYNARASNVGCDPVAMGVMAKGTIDYLTFEEIDGIIDAINKIVNT